MIHFAQAEYLLMILLIPLFFVIYAMARKGRNKKIAKLGNPALMAALMIAPVEIVGIFNFSLTFSA